MELMSKLPLEQSATPTNMASSTSDHATHAVFGTNELLCDIVSRLPLKKIVIITGVCKTWRKAILDNVAIQQTLFLAPAAIRDITSEVDCLSMRLQDMSRDQYTIVAEFHSQAEKLWNCEKPNVIEPIFNTLKSGPSPLGVWQNMFVTQPPSKAVYITISEDASQPRQRTRTSQWPGDPWQLVFTRETGIKIGELHAFCQSEIRKHTNATSLKVSLVPRGITASKDIVASGRWEVHNGEVVRQTQPRLIELSDDSSGRDDSDDFYDVMYERYDMYGGHYPGGDSDEGFSPDLDGDYDYPS